MELLPKVGVAAFYKSLPWFFQQEGLVHVARRKKKTFKKIAEISNFCHLIYRAY